MLLPYTVDVPMERLPLANWLLIGVTAVVSGVLLAAEAPRLANVPAVLAKDNPTRKEAEDLRRLLLEPAAPPLALDRRHFAAWQLFSYALVHAELFHLAGNLVFLFCFGNAVNAKLGQVPFLILYALLGAVAGLAWLLLGVGAALVGASGAIMGVTGIFFVLYPRNDVSVFYWLGFAWAGTFTVSSYWVVLLGMAADLLGTFLGPDGSVAYVAHLAGELCGALLAVGLLLLGIVRSGSAEENLLQLLGVALPAEGERRPGGEAEVPIQVKRRSRPPVRKPGKG